MKKASTAALILAVISASVQAGNPWVKVGTTAPGAELWYNPKTVSRSYRDVSVQTLMSYKGSANVSLTLIDCEEWTYSMQGESLVVPKRYIAPSAPMNTLATKLCG